MLRNLKTAVVVFVLAMGVLSFSSGINLVSEVSAQNTVDGGLDAIKGAYPAGVQEDLDPATLAEKIINWALYISVMIAVLFIIYGGFLYITSAGDQTAAAKGKNTLVNAIIGFVIIILSYIIIRVVYNFLVS